VCYVPQVLPDQRAEAGSPGDEHAMPLRALG
jgi:hypothetical protein